MPYLPEPLYIKKQKLKGIQQNLEKTRVTKNVKNALKKDAIDEDDVLDPLCSISLGAWAGSSGLSMAVTGTKALKVSTQVTNYTLPFCNFFYFFSDSKNAYQVSRFLSYLEEAHKKFKIPYVNNVVIQSRVNTLRVNNKIFEGTINALGTNKTNFTLSAADDALNVIGSIFVLTGLFSNPITMFIGIGLGIITTVLYADRLYKSYSHNEEKNIILSHLTHPEKQLALYKKEFKLQYSKFCLTTVGSDKYKQYGKKLINLMFHMTGSKNMCQDVKAITVEKSYQTVEQKAITFSAKFALDALIFNYESQNEHKNIEAKKMIILLISKDKKRSGLLAKFKTLPTHDDRFEFLRKFLKINRDFWHNDRNRFRRAILKNKHMSLI